MNPVRREFAIDCLGAVVGWLGLTIICSLLFSRQDGTSFSSEWNMLWPLKIAEGGVLGAVTAQAIARVRAGRYRDAARPCLWWGGLIGAFYIFFIACGHVAHAAPGASFRMLLMWNGVPLLWALAVFVAGVALACSGEVVTAQQGVPPVGANTSRLRSK